MVCSERRECRTALRRSAQRGSAYGLRPDTRPRATGPLNAYVVRATEELAAEAVPRGLGVSLHFAHETAPGRLVAMQRLAHLAKHPWPTSMAENVHAC